jgi:hypothetical protein
VCELQPRRAASSSDEQLAALVADVRRAGDCAAGSASQVVLLRDALAAKNTKIESAQLSPARPLFLAAYRPPPPRRQWSRGCVSAS